MTMYQSGQRTPKPSIGRPMQILLVEDSPSDAAMTAAALSEGSFAYDMHVVADGEDAMAFLRREGPFVDMPRPDLILLDLNLPRKDGREVLAEVKADASLQIIPIVVLTTSSAEVDIVRSYQLHANSYVTKPVNLDDFFETIRSIEHFWLTLVRLPDGTTT